MNDTLGRPARKKCKISERVKRLSMPKYRAAPVIIGVNLLFFAANLIALAAEQHIGGLHSALIFRADNLARGEVWRLVTYILYHNGVPFFLFGTLTLSVLCTYIEKKLGAARTLFCYFGLAALFPLMICAMMFPLYGYLNLGMIGADIALQLMGGLAGGLYLLTERPAGGQKNPYTAAYAVLYFIVFYFLLLSRSERNIGNMYLAFGTGFLAACVSVGSPRLTVGKTKKFRIKDYPATLMILGISAAIFIAACAAIDKTYLISVYGKADTVTVLRCLWDGLGGDPVQKYLVLDTAAVAKGEVWRILTSMFTHDGISHIVGNAVIIAFMRFYLEPKLGSARLLGLFIFSGMFVCLTWVAGGRTVVGGGGSSWGFYAFYPVYFVLLLRERSAKRSNLFVFLFLTGSMLAGNLPVVTGGWGEGHFLSFAAGILFCLSDAAAAQLFERKTRMQLML